MWVSLKTLCSPVWHHLRTTGAVWRVLGSFQDTKCVVLAIAPMKLLLTIATLFGVLYIGYPKNINSGLYKVHLKTTCTRGPLELKHYCACVELHILVLYHPFQQFSETWTSNHGGAVLWDAALPGQTAPRVLHFSAVHFSSIRPVLLPKWPLYGWVLHGIDTVGTAHCVHFTESRSFRGFVYM